jgi:hypothetical protein
MPGKYDPPDKAALRAQNPRTDSICELMVAAAEAQFPPKVKDDESASRARPEESAPVHFPKRGRKRVVTPERVRLICELIGKGETEQLACIRAGIGSTAWSAAKRADANLRHRINSARDDWARLRHAQLAAARNENQWTRSAGRKALKPTPTKQANLVVWHLMYRVPLNFAIIPQEEIKKACEQFSMSLDQWGRQERTFALLKKVYAKRAKIRGEQPQAAWMAVREQVWESGDEYYDCTSS